MNQRETQEYKSPPVRWAARVPQALIWRLYESDARGIVDEDLIDEVGVALYARCESILRLTDAYIRGRVECPSCRRIVVTTVEGRHQNKELPIQCDGCGWETTWLAYKQTFLDKRLHAGNAAWIFREFVEKYPKAGLPRQKMMLIDRLLHEFHRGRDLGDRGPATTNVIEGTWQQVLALLDSLAGLRTAEDAEAWSRRFSDSGAGRRLARRSVGEGS